MRTELEIVAFTVSERQQLEDDTYFVACLYPIPTIHTVRRVPEPYQAGYEHIHISSRGIRVNGYQPGDFR